MSVTTTSGNKFVFLACCYNMSETLPQMLMSIIGQSYDNWKIVVTDDVSSEDHLAKTTNTIDRFRSLLGPDRYKLQFHRNTQKRWEVENVLTMLSADCNDNDIICRIDADDWLTELDALAMINQAYNSTECDALWTAHRWGFSDKNISGPMPAGSNPYQHAWVSSHLKTFRKKLLNGVNDVNYRGIDGSYIKRAGDQAIYLPALHNAKKWVFVPRVMYHYTINDVPETYQTADAVFQRDEAVFLRSRGYVE